MSEWMSKSRNECVTELILVLFYSKAFIEAYIRVYRSTAISF